MAHNVIIETHLRNGSKLQLRGLAGTEPIMIELDHSAADKLAGDATGRDFRPAIEASHETIKSVAERLINEGYFTKIEDKCGSNVGKSILITALDLE